MPNTGYARTPTTGRNGTVYAASPEVASFQAARGVLRSRDGGRTWQAVNTGLPTLDVRRVAANRRGGVLAVTASGVYASKNDGDTWQALPGLEGLNLQSAVLGDDGIAYAATLTTLYRHPRAHVHGERRSGEDRRRVAQHLAQPGARHGTGEFHGD